ncbi:hypothetical protein WICPIJ_008858 [Wickerhamomyces pijperi]|uniref:Uncharacterized protein n=1 Tax=Wickerhamomyces pijperi TaxID=599730 RepID=A0A9P8TH82_WICPI|nr:hypothetical protein WICPIJ_008858 [Wickerhamomyces pijperi]
MKLSWELATRRKSSPDIISGGLPVSAGTGSSSSSSPSSALPSSAGTGGGVSCTVIAATVAVDGYSGVFSQGMDSKYFRTNGIPRYTLS